jgi:nucleotide-binding universal stress UspA family protein
MVAVAERIVVGYDGSEGAMRALERTAELAGYAATVTVVNVAKPLYPHTFNAVPDPVAVEDGKQLLRTARERLAARGIAARAVERVGEPARELVEAARELGADLLVVGDGKNALERFLLGSVSTHAVHHAPCDVLVVRGGESGLRTQAD